MVRKAFTLIELIFAIVVMSIVMLSFPIIMQVDSDAREQGFAQEAVLAASAKMAQLFTYQWDEGSLSWEDLNDNIQTVARILDGTDANTTAFNRVGTTELRPSGGHRHFFTTGTNATPMGDDNNATIGGYEVVIGLDEQAFPFSDGSGFEAGSVAGSFSYKRNYDMRVDILRIDDNRRIDSLGDVNYTRSDLSGNNGFVFSQNDIHNNPAANPADQTNLRAMAVSIRERSSGRLITTLYGYTANIGEYSAYSRVRP